MSRSSRIFRLQVESGDTRTTRITDPAVGYPISNSGRGDPARGFALVSVVRHFLDVVPEHGTEEEADQAADQTEKTPDSPRNRAVLLSSTTISFRVSAGSGPTSWSTAPGIISDDTEVFQCRESGAAGQRATTVIEVMSRAPATFRAKPSRFIRFMGIRPVP